MNFIFSKISRSPSFLAFVVLTSLLNPAFGVDEENANKVEVEPESVIKEIDHTNKLAIGEDLKINGKRHPKLSFNLSNIPGFISGLSGPNDNFGSSTISPMDSSSLGLGEKLGSTGVGIASTALLIKSGLLGGLTAIKAAIIPPIFVGSMVLFLIAGAVYFTCSVLNCGFGPASTNGSPSLTSFFNRNGYDYYDQQVQPVYQSIDEGYKKFN